jgi:hypothetical protein
MPNPPPGAGLEKGRSVEWRPVPDRAIMLQLRPNCECCDRDLPPESTEAVICSFECTFCTTCAETTLQGKCPNCGGELVRRPRRPAEKLARNPASTERVRSSQGCRS